MSETIVVKIEKKQNSLLMPIVTPFWYLLSLVILPLSDSYLFYVLSNKSKTSSKLLIYYYDSVWFAEYNQWNLSFWEGIYIFWGKQRKGSTNERISGTMTSSWKRNQAGLGVRGILKTLNMLVCYHTLHRVEIWRWETLNF